MDERVIQDIQKTILDWYQNYGRHDLPWRNLDKLGIDIPYGVLVAEFMLQQTQVERVNPKYIAFLTRFPTVESLAKAPVADVIMLWSGLGYNRRAILLHKAASEITAKYQAKVPSDVNALQSLPGIGAYTAAAIASFGYNQSVVVMDTNIERFYELLFYGYNRPSTTELYTAAQELIPANQSRDWHSALMDLVTLIRRARTPREQQKLLLQELQLNPSWDLPQLTDEPLFRPKQAGFRTSKRFIRGKIIAFLGQQKDYQTSVKNLKDYLAKQNIPIEYSVEDVLMQLKRDGLIVFDEPFTFHTTISLP